MYDIDVANKGGTFYVRAKCRPTMIKTPPFYVLFVVVQDQQPIGGNCFCAAGASQSCVHISALLLTLAEITPQACTSVSWAWSRPSVGGSASLAKDLDFGQASLEGYFHTLDLSLIYAHFSKIWMLQGLNRELLIISKENKKGLLWPVIQLPTK